VSDFGRARMAGMVGIVLGFLLVYAVGELAVVIGTSLDFGVIGPLVEIPSLVLVGYAVWLLSKLAASPRIFWFYLVGIAIPLVANLVFWTGLFTVSLVSTPVSVQVMGYFVPTVGLYGAYLIGDVLVFLSYTMIARALGYGLFRTAAIVTLAAGVMAVPTALLVLGFDSGTAMVTIVAGFLGLASIVLQVAAFNSLATKPQSQAPAAPAVSSA